jgi:hypothetical protein
MRKTYESLRYPSRVNSRAQTPVRRPLPSLVAKDDWRWRAEKVEDLKLSTGVSVPHAHRPIPAAGNDDLAVPGPAERHRQDRVGVPSQWFA